MNRLWNERFQDARTSSTIGCSGPADYGRCRAGCSGRAGDVSYDAAEQDDYTVIQLVDAAGRPHGYYIMAESITAEWMPQSACLLVW